jgi:hypothetical protein
MGPFTPLQKQFVKNNMLVRPNSVLCALHWLKQHNQLYRDITIPNENDLATPLIIDDTDNVESQDTNIESRMEYTVVFPETDRISAINGGCMSQEEFRRQVVNAMDTTTESAPAKSRASATSRSRFVPGATNIAAVGRTLMKHPANYSTSLQL